MLPVNIVVTGLPGEVGAVLPGTEMIRAFELSASARTLGLEGEIYVVHEDGTSERVDTATKARAPKADAPWTARDRAQAQG